MKDKFPKRPLWRHGLHSRAAANRNKYGWLSASAAGMLGWIRFHVQRIVRLTGVIFAKVKAENELNIKALIL